ncbi:carboxypeptidase-like regulatory domain-containing protein [Ekhidna sp. MALMAid0563]|uniref:carboxypeptidase-like regulatory domain-containing protein n=1 Tax=Ekhidna sp. MALMAid0563 TaxID=3143937 RepID=UPI0032DF7DA8
MRASLCLALCVLTLSVVAQKRKSDIVNGSFNDVPLEVIFDSLSVQTNYFFSYNSDLLPKGSLYTITADNTPIDQFLSKLLVGTGLKYSFFKDQIILNYEPPEQIVKRKKNIFTISGTVYDESGQPLQDANVFLDGTTIGVSSDIDGNYKLEGIPPGYYDLVFSHVGYEYAVYQISEYNGGARIQNHQMEIDMGQLEEVEVISNRINRSENSWQTYYQTFREELIGQSENANNCVIENPEVLNFTYDNVSNTLTAFSQHPLQIRNDALGYRISYFLESFRKRESDLRFRGKIRFRNLEPLNGKERREWKRNRKEGYEGSFNHFKSALLNNELRKEGFRIYHLKNLENFEMDKADELSESDIILFKGDHYELDFKNYLLIEYRKEKESMAFLNKSESVPIFYGHLIDRNGVLVKSPGNQLSVLKLLKRSVRLDLTGEVIDRFGMTTYGYWSWERTADLVPINYDPKFENL